MGVRSLTSQPLHASDRFLMLVCLIVVAFAITAAATASAVKVLSSCTKSETQSCSCGSMTTLRIGAMFSPFDAQGNVDSDQTQALAAFIMAVDEVNSNCDFLESHWLKYVFESPTDYIVADVADEFYGAIAAAQALIDQNVDFVVTAGSNIQTMASGKEFNSHQVCQLHIRANATELGRGTDYPYHLSMVPSLSYQGVVWQQILCKHFDVTHISIFYVDDDFGIVTNAEFQDVNATECSQTVLSEHAVRPDELDFSIEIARAKASQAKVFMFFLPPLTAANLIQAGFTAGLFGEGTQLFGVEDLITTEIFGYLAPKDVVRTLKGMVSIQLESGFSLREPYAGGTDTGQVFVSAFQNLVLDCNEQDDATPTPSYTFRKYGNSTGKCALSTTQTFAQQFTDKYGRDIYNHAAHAYDAVYALAYGADVLYYDKMYDASTSQYTMGDMLHDTMRKYVDFNGATGRVRFENGTNIFNNYGKGNRESGSFYSLWNFDSHNYLASGGNDSSFVYLGHWNTENQTKMCTSLSIPDLDITPNNRQCHNITYNSKDGKEVDDLPPFTKKMQPEYVKIGGIFNTFNETGGVDSNQAISLAAFLMAVEEINANKDLLPNTRLVTAISSGYSFFGGVQSAEFLASSAFGTTGVAAVVSAGTYEEVQAALQIFTKKNILQIATEEQDVRIDFGATYPTKMQILPPDSYEGAGIQEIMCNFFGYSKISVFASEDDRGSLTTNEATDSTYCDQTIMSVSSFLISTTEEQFVSIIEKVQATGSRIFACFMPPKTLARLLTKGYEMGLFVEGTMIFVSSDAGLMATYHLLDPKIAAVVMKGMMVLRYSPSYNLRNSGAGQRFVANFRAQKDTVYMLDGKQECNTTLDDNGFFRLYREQGHSGSDAVQCSGLRFQQTFTAWDGSDIHPFAALAYDAVYAIAHGIHNRFEIAKDKKLDTMTLIKEMIANVAFAGATGDISFGAGVSAFNGFGHGDRESDVTYIVYNFNPDLIDKASAAGGVRRLDSSTATASDAFQYVGTWNDATGFAVCTSAYDVDGQLTPCKSIVFNTHDGLPPLDTPPTIVLYLDASLSALLYFVGALTLLVTIFFEYVVIQYRASSLIKASQPAMLHFTLAGGVLGAGRIWSGASPLSDSTCIANFWLGHLCFWLIFGAILCKTYRVHRIFNHTGFKRIKYSNQDVINSMIGILSFVCVYMAIATGVGKPHKSNFATTVSNQRTELLLCNMEISAFDTTLYVFEAVILVAGARICWQVREIPDAVNESKYIASAMMVILLICSLVMPIVFLIPGLSPSVQELIASIFIGIAVIAALCILFGPKAWILLRGQDIELMGAKPGAKKGGGTIAMQDVSKQDSGGDDGAQTRAHDSLQDATKALLKGHYAEKAALCNSQIAAWRAILLRLQDSESTGSGSNGSSSTGGSRKKASDSDTGTSIQRNSRYEVVPIDEMQPTITNTLTAAEGALEP